MNYLYINCLGQVVLDDSFSVLEVASPEKKEYLPQRYKNLRQIEARPEVLLALKNPAYFSGFREQNMKLTQEALRKAVTEDVLITHAIAAIGELDRVVNLLSKRLREWFGTYCPELGHDLGSNQKFAELVIQKKRSEILQDLKRKETMGGSLDDRDVQEIQRLAEEIIRLMSLREKHEQYLERVMQRHCPNVLALAGVTVGARLIELGKGLRHLALLPSSTIQLLGAEKALFRHLKTGSRSPKYGVLLSHPIVQRAGSHKGKAARALADKLSLCARLDYFKGDFKAPTMRKELEEKFP